MKDFSIHGIIFGWVVAVLLVAGFGYFNFLHSNLAADSFWGNFANWDGRHFLEIAKSGYQVDFQLAFFPLFPLLIRTVGMVLPNLLVSALLINLVATWLGLLILYQLVKVEYSDQVAKLTILALVTFPTAFFFLMVYSEATFFLLTMLTFEMLARKRWWWAAIFSGGATATRFVGLSVSLAVLITTKKRLVLAILSVIGLIIYSGSLLIAKGNPFYYFVAEAHWQRIPWWPGIGFLDNLKLLTRNGFNFVVLADLLIAVFGLGLAIRTFRFLPRRYSVYALSSLLIPLFTPTLLSFSRFILPVFPIFILIGLSKDKYLLRIYFTVSTLTQISFIILFINGYWVS